MAKHGHGMDWQESEATPPLRLLIIDTLRNRDEDAERWNGMWPRYTIGSQYITKIEFPQTNGSVYSRTLVLVLETVND